MEIQELYQLFQTNPIIDTDSRAIREKSIFFALKGENFNANIFAEDALKKGASFAVVDEDLNPSNPNIILVDDVLETLQKLANYHRNQLNIPIISLTGSNGKTTTKELINAVLSTKFNTIATKGNLNNHIGVPLTLLSITKDTEIAIVEMGANHQKEIEFLCSIAEPNYGYITNFGKAHLEGFGGIEGVIKGKSELYDFLRKTNGLVFANFDDDIQFEKSLGIKTVSFDIKSDFIELLEANPFVKIRFNDIEIKSNLIGNYNVNNIAAAITIGMFFKVPEHDIKSAIENYIPSNNRSQLMKIGTNTIFMDAYNANPSSMKVALENFYQVDGNSKIIVLGDMFELGETSLTEHQAIADLIADLNFKQVYLVGNHFSSIKTKNSSQYTDFEQFKNKFDAGSIQNATILIKGSRGMALERVLDLLK
ncbi:MAG: UDP-N-acetylmuramoyl-tripeptide--D-alanyl-D-alanine ligase [Flavobacteriaceae bacterium]|nr:UDP-N-acetylmuramoyl-tripeptide--D-alanyl-D-alanine ligase [Flavobacteriaceae bacterium]